MKKEKQNIKTKKKNFYQSIVIQLKKYLFIEKYKFLILFIILGLLAWDILFVPTDSDKNFYGITLLFFITAFFYRLSSRITFVICLVLLIAMFINFLFSDASFITEKIAVWLFLFMGVGVLQQWIE